MKQLYIVGNWKMNLTLAENQKLAKDLEQNYQPLEKLKLIVAPQFPALPILSEILKNSPIELAAQNSCFETKGAYTGEDFTCTIIRVTMSLLHHRTFGKKTYF